MGNTPNIRFKGFTDDWEQRKLGESVSITSGEAPSKFEVGTELYVKVDDLNYNDKYVVDTQNKVAEHSTVKRVTKGSVVFPKRGAAIMTNKVRIMGIDGYMDTNMMALTSEKLDSEFLYNIISKEGLYKIADTSTIPQINNKHVEPYEVTIPSLDEQRKIGAYFKQLDHLITLHQRKGDETKKLKKFMLQKMFPKKDAKKPEIRFAGFTDDWEQRKLGESVSITSGEAPSKFEVGTELYVKVDDLNYNDKYVVDTQNKVAEHSTVKRVTKGSVVFPKRGAAIMTNKVRIMGIDGYMDTNMMALTSEKLDSEFLYNIISKEGLYKIADTSTIPQINNKHVEPYEVTIPSLDEQRKIGAYFKQLDHLITLHQRKCDELKEFKKYMLQNMFPQKG